MAMEVNYIDTHPRLKGDILNVTLHDVTERPIITRTRGLSTRVYPRRIKAGGVVVTVYVEITRQVSS